MTNLKLEFKVLKGKYGVCKLNSKDYIPHWLNKDYFYSITKTEEELSIVCFQENIPTNVLCERNWRILKIEGQLDFSLIGILSKISTLLAKESISIFAISTYNTDYILVQEEKLPKAINILRKHGHKVSNICKS